MVLALLYLTMFEDKPAWGLGKGTTGTHWPGCTPRATSPIRKGKTKSVVMSTDGAQRAQELFQ
jgi:hypothetical protein